MSGTREIILDAQPSGSGSVFLWLWSILKRVLSVPILRRLQPWVWRFKKIAEPPGRVTIRDYPDTSNHSANGVLSVMSANLWHDWPLHRRLAQRLEAFADLVETQGIDILLLQEVARTHEVRYDEWLAKRLGMAYVYSRVNGHECGLGFEEGLAVFSRYPLIQAHLTQMEPHFEPFARRLALAAVVGTPVGVLPFVSVHLGVIPSHNAAHVRHLHTWVKAVSGARSAIIGGDFNSSEHTAQIKQMRNSWLDAFRHVHPNGDGNTYSLRLPWGGRLGSRRLDYLFIHPGDRSWKVLEAQHLDSPAGPHSDHRAVLARISPIDPD